MVGGVNDGNMMDDNVSFSPFITLKFEELNSPPNTEDELTTLTMKPIEALESYKSIDGLDLNPSRLGCLEINSYKSMDSEERSHIYFIRDVNWVVTCHPRFPTYNRGSYYMPIFPRVLTH
ncbi:hypothetical protein PanWU01x14_198790 [Parasponia andersonii]|uniref:Uncharacterized protein n=1 Tax=Parasponia andersonii TaxID=3476 RepID=A0A2P5BYJ1_PARAD|nr:hypothetical protein PanWU01x14_198790 [Parasponia andersonii]